MKKKAMSVSAMLLAAALLLSGCSASSRTAAPGNKNTVAGVLEAQTGGSADGADGAQNAQSAGTDTGTDAGTPETAPGKEPETTPETTPETAPGAASGATSDASSDTQADIDLTSMDSNMVYAEVYSMMTTPQDFVGKNVKIKGKYYAEYYDTTKKYYHYVVIADALGCCSQGMEFIWNGEHTYPDDYPAKDAEVEITGVFGIYQEQGTAYCYLATDGITVISQP